MPLIPDLGALLNSALISNASRGPSYASGVRNAIVFTSSLRERAAGAQSLAELDQDVFRLTSTLIASKALLPQVVMPLNPDFVTFRQSKRWTKKDTREGSVFFHFTNEQGQNNDVLTMEFKGSSGNIDRRGVLLTDRQREEAAAQGTAISSAQQDTGAIAKILAFWNLYALTREPVLLPDRTENVMTITYISPLFPQTIDFFGFYNQVLDFDETAEEPNERKYRFEFTVTSSDPPIDTIIEDIFSVLQLSTLEPSSTGFITGQNVVVTSP